MTIMKTKKDLGKGIRALLGDVNISEVKTTDSVVKKLANETAMVPVSDITTNPFQPRQDFAADALLELSQSIKLHGLVQPLTVRILADGKYQLISGERRLRASKLAGLKEVPAYIRIADDQQLLEWALIENIQRKDLNPLEVALSYQRLIDECKLTHESLAERVAKDRSSVTNFLRLLKLPPVVQQSLRNGQISMGHARALAGIEDITALLELHKETLQKEYSVRALEQAAKSIQSSKQSKAVNSKPERDFMLKKLEDRMAKMFETKIQIKQAKMGSGNIQIHFASTEELNRILETLDII